MPASRADLLRPLPSLTEMRNRTPAADEELRCMSNHLVNKALLRPTEPGVPVAGGIEAECPTHHATEHHLPATTRTRQAGDGDKSRNNFTASNPFAPDAQTTAGQAPAAQTATVPAHSPTPNQG